MILVLFGPPGAGKGTQSQLLAEKYNLCHVSTGDLLRTGIKTQTSLGLKARKFVDEGALVPDSIMIGLIEETVQTNLKGGFLFDGFPRTVDQASALDKMLDKRHELVAKAIFLEVNRDLLHERLTGRRVCTTCGSTFHMTLKQSAQPGICDKCGSPLEQRKDDSAEVIDNRLEVYEKSTSPLKAYYTTTSKLAIVDGVGSPEIVFRRISSVIH